MVVSWGFYLVENFDREIFVFGVVDLWFVCFVLNMVVFVFCLCCNVLWWDLNVLKLKYK